MVNYSYLEGKHWRKFFDDLVFGDSAAFTASDYKEVEVARAAATQYNNRTKRGYTIKVSNRPASDQPMLVTIKTVMV